ncbi:D-aminoacyl-tRNA deacylase [Flavobacteriales bacterium]|nr:D-aminoacyl-tRNA deacylase [Flavobacteriales bacterium]MDC1062853.1 D-aminoacyl-tRNA deacylase [Flavobacteriales bacterium]
MKVVIQRVSDARVKVNDKIISEIKLGFLVLLGVEKSDSQTDINWLVSKISNLRVFSDDELKMNLSIKDVKGEIIVVSQFTLHAKTKKGNRPSYTKAASPEQAEQLYEEFISLLKNESEVNVQSGVFGANMQVDIVNDGPVTIIIDSKNKE